jgi:hypothetical protein
MKEVYLAYFDFMGFKQFIQNNEDEILMRRMGHSFRDIEISLGKGKYQEPKSGVILADLSESKINCLNISDTVLFWTNTCSQEDLLELVEVAYSFNWREIGYNFPLRGSIVKGKIKVVSGKNENQNGGTYSVQCLYGKGLVYAHDIAEAQEWAGSILDENVVEDLNSFKDGKEFLEKNTVKYNVPFKNEFYKEFRVFKLKQGKLNEVALKNTLKAIDDVFSQDKKSIDNDNVQLKILNTKKFIEYTKDVE